MRFSAQTVEEKQASAVKRDATRKARKVMERRQRLKVVGEPAPPAQATPPPAAPAAPPAPAHPAEAPKPTSGGA
jgi:hypothetical protein